MLWMNRRRVRALSLLCRCLSPHVEAQAVRTQLATADWGTVVDIANHYFVAPALWAGLARKGLLDEIPAPPRDYLTAMYRFNAQRNSELRVQLEGAVAALNRVGIEPLLLKGAVALVDPDEFPGARFMMDLDLRVGPHLAQAAATALMGVGYRFKEKGEEQHADPHHLMGLYLPGAPARIEVHRRLLLDQRLDAAFAQGLETESTTLVGGGQAWVMSPRYHLLHNIVHSEISHGAHTTRYLDLKQMAIFAQLACGGDGTQLASALYRLNLGTVWESYALAMRNLFGLALADARPGSAARVHYGMRLALFELAPRYPWVWQVWGGVLQVGRAFSRSHLECRYGGSWRPFATRFRHSVYLLRAYSRPGRWSWLRGHLGHKLRGWSGQQ